MFLIYDNIFSSGYYHLTIDLILKFKYVSNWKQKKNERIYMTNHQQESIYIRRALDARAAHANSLKHCRSIHGADTQIQYKRINTLYWCERANRSTRSVVASAVGSGITFVLEQYESESPNQLLFWNKTESYHPYFFRSVTRKFFRGVAKTLWC